MAQQRDGKVRLKISGERNVEGEIAAKGELQFRIADASKASFHFDYREDDRLVVGVRSTAGFRILGDRPLGLSGGFDYDVEREEWKGNVTAELDISKDIEVKIQQRFTPEGNATAVSLTVTF